MSNSDKDDPSGRAAKFAAEAGAKQGSLLGEVMAFLRDTRKWWLAPIIIVLLLMGLLVVLGGSAAAPFIYTLF